ncbi:MAG TPA: carbon-nitrogen hydrolase family protein [Longimicrobiales bacterium]
MSTREQTIKIAAVQAAPVFLDLDRSVDKACRLIQEAADHGAALVVFPESFLPTYPFWVWFIPPGHTHPLRELYAALHENSITLPGAAISRVANAAARAHTCVAIGASERNSESSGGSLFNTFVMIDADGRIRGRHRKLVPTAGERLVWAHGDGSDLEVYDLPFGRVGGLICWENYMPLARYALASWGEQIHVAPTWDRGEPWTSSMRHIAKESRCFVISCCQALHMNDIPDEWSFKRAYLGGLEDWINPGHSLIADPDGKLVAGPLEQVEGILYADVQLAQLVGPRWQLDIAGHYSRPDVFELRIHRSPRPDIIESE